MIDQMPRRSLPRDHWRHAHRVMRVCAKLGRVPHSGANWLAMLYAASIIRVPTWPEILAHMDDANYVARARAAIA